MKEIYYWIINIKMEKKNDFSFYLDNEENHFNNRDLLKDLISKLDYQYPSFIQEKILISKNIKDLNNPVSCSIIKSEAGTGKTLAYLIPLIQSIDLSIENQIQSIIITPTRELSLQIEEYLSKLKNIKYKISIGGKANIPGKIKKEILDKNNIPTILAGTLGKLREILFQKKAKTFSKNYLKYLKCIVVDEADKMIEQNKPPQNLLESFLNYIFSFIFNKNNELDKNTKNIILCSASLNKINESFYSTIISKYVNKKEENNNIFNYFDTNLELNEIETTKILNENIKEYYIKFYEKKHESFYEQKYKSLIILLSSLQKEYNQCLIFYNKKSKGQELSQDLRNYGFSICFIHGDLDQDKRQLIYYKIKTLEYKIILSTDLLSRGIDLTAVNLVINFDSAYDSLEQFHRNGRTGRFFEKGIVISFKEEKNQIEEKKYNNEYNSDDLNKILENIKSEFIKSERLSKEEIEKINLGENKNKEILKDALTEINGINLLLQKKRKLQYESESLVKIEDKDKAILDENEEEIEDLQSLEKEKKETKGEKKKFCLYCDLFKIFDEQC